MRGRNTALIGLALLGVMLPMGSASAANAPLKPGEIVITEFFDPMYRIDSATGAKQEHFFGPGRWGAEAPFAPCDGSSDETDGYLVSFISDEREGRCRGQKLSAKVTHGGPEVRS